MAGPMVKDVLHGIGGQELESPVTKCGISWEVSSEIKSTEAKPAARNQHHWGGGGDATERWGRHPPPFQGAATVSLTPSASFNGICNR